MPTKTYQVLKEFDPKKHGQIKTTPAVIKCLKLFKKGVEFQPHEFIKENADYLTPKSKNKPNACQSLVSISIKFGRELGLLEYKETKPITYNDFRNLESIQYMSNQLRGSKVKNLKTKEGYDNSTKRHYVMQLHYFNNWLYGKSFEFNITKQIDVDTFKKERTKITLEGVEHFLKLYQASLNSESDFVRIIKLYLMDDINKKCSARYMAVKYSAIKSYFERNDSPIKFRYNPTNKHNDYSEENEDAVLTLAELHKLLSNSNSLEKSVILCKFHRGLDSSTLADRFNFQVSKQLVDWFGTTDFENWDLSKCPVPIKVTRIKTDYTHTGYLDVDAITSIQDYLNSKYFSYVITNKRKGIDENYLRDKKNYIDVANPLFVDRKNKPISINWVSRVVPRLARKAGIQKMLQGDRLQKRTEKNGHELRDLLKSTLIASGCVDYVCELAIGHKVGDSYSKQDKLYPEKSRKEYSKASKKLNIFTKFTSVVNGIDNEDELKLQLKEQIEESNKLLKKQKEQVITRYQDEFFAKNQQKKMKEQDEKMSEVLQIVDDLKSQIDSLKKGKPEKLEFCCIGCEMVHDKESCPACGSKQRRIYEKSVQN